MVIETGDYHCQDIESVASQIVDKLKGINIVGYAEISADSSLLNIAGINTQYDIYLVFKLFK